MSIISQIRQQHLSDDQAADLLEQEINRRLQERLQPIMRMSVADFLAAHPVAPAQTRQNAETLGLVSEPEIVKGENSKGKRILKKSLKTLGSKSVSALSWGIKTLWNNEMVGLCCTMLGLSASDYAWYALLPFLLILSKIIYNVSGNMFKAVRKGKLIEIGMNILFLGIILLFGYGILRRNKDSEILKWIKEIIVYIYNNLGVKVVLEYSVNQTKTFVLETLEDFAGMIGDAIEYALTSILNIFSLLIRSVNIFGETTVGEWVEGLSGLMEKMSDFISAQGIKEAAKAGAEIIATKVTAATDFVKDTFNTITFFNRAVKGMTDTLGLPSMTETSYTSLQQGHGLELMNNNPLELSKKEQLILEDLTNNILLEISDLYEHIFSVQSIKSSIILCNKKYINTNAGVLEFVGEECIIYSVHYLYNLNRFKPTFIPQLTSNTEKLLLKGKN